MKQIIIIWLFLSFTLLNAQNQQLSKLRLVQKDLRKEISVLNDSLLIINKKIDSLNKLSEQEIKQQRLANISDKEIIATTNESAILREKPFTNSKIIKSLETETLVVVQGFVNNYYKCCIGNECGFIHFISIKENEKTDMVKKSSILNIDDYIDEPEKVNKEGLNRFTELSIIAQVYKFPSSQSFTLSNFAKSEVEVISYFNGFFKVKDSTNNIGFVKSYGLNKKDYFIDKLNESTLNDTKLKNQNILIRGVNVSDVNSAGGVEISVEWLYLNKKKDIKYIEFTFQPFNNVSDLQKSEIGNSINFTGIVTGPIKASEKFKTLYWENAWYNSTISCVKITKVKVIYMDGSSYTYIKELPKILDSNFSNSCK